MARDPAETVLTINGRDVRITHGDKPYFTRGAKLTKLDVVQYFLSVAPGAVRGIRDRPIVLKRFVNGAEQEPFYQKRAPESRPEWVRTVTLAFPSGRTAEEVVVDDAAGLAWVVNLGCIELHPHAVSAADLDHPDELRIDLDPVPGVPWDDVRRVALETRAFLDELGLVGKVKTSGSRGIHVNVPILPRWTFSQVWRAALTFSRAIERRAPTLATSKWWKEERHGVFLDYNQNAKDRTTCSAYSVRPLPDARVSTPLEWAEVPACEPGDFTVFTVPARFAALGDVHSADVQPGSLEGLLELADRDAAEGLGDAPWPPHFRKAAGEAPRVAPSRAKRPARARKGAGDEGRVARSTMPLIIVANSPDRDAALAGLERWMRRHPKAAEHLAVDDVLVDSMRGRSSTWTRIRVNLRNVPEADRPAQATPDPDDDPTRVWRTRMRESRAATVASPEHAFGSFLQPGEVEALLADDRPGVVARADYLGDLQMHSIWSDGTQTFDAIVRGCMARGYAYAAVTDHSYGLRIANGVAMADVPAMHRDIDRVNAHYAGQFRILKGIEANIKADGSMDLSRDELAQFELVVAAPHSALTSPADRTARMVAAVQTPGVHILGHPRGRKRGGREGVKADWDKVFAAAAVTGVAIEIDGDPSRQDIDHALAVRAMAAGCVFALDSDAHAVDQLAYVDVAIAHARLAGIPPDRVINTWPLERLLAWLSR